MIEKNLKALVDDFHRNIDTYKTNACNEANTRIQFIDRFFELLGWDVNNKQGFSEAYKEVVHEDSLKIGSYMKAPDYSFRLGGSRVFFVEAKKPAIDIKNDIVPAYQLRRYGWTAKLPVSILTDFEEFAVYDCRVKPNQTDKASTARILYFTYKDYLEKWDEIYSLFAKENILKGSLENFVKSAKKVKGTSEVDKEFLKEISSWRDVLAKNIALRNPNLSSRDLNFCVQRTIDRIIFLRMCEDRGIEDYGRLKALTNGGRIYPRLFQLFQAADDRYNSGLFYFRKEKGREEQPDEVSPLIEIDDKIIKNILTNLYYPDCPYEFSVLPADILGNVYEQFLGKVIRLTAGHQAKVEEKPEVKKAGGVYYTPKYIVDYIVENTIGEFLNSKNSPFPKGGEGDLNINSHLKKGARGLSKLKILDPACGSGSFLLGAYQYLLDWHLKFYSENDPEKWLKKKNPPIYQCKNPLLRGVPDRAGCVPKCEQNSNYKLTTPEKKRILVNHIYGVDIDSQAVEVTKLSLLLKVLEDVNQDALESQLKLFHERALPDLSRNIKCGNSLIGPDFYENQQLDLLDEEEQLKINIFDWQSAFPDVFNQQNPGFDVVIGNPPWVSLKGKFGNEICSDTEREYLISKYKGDTYRPNIYEYFVKKALKLVNKNGIHSFIVPDRLGFNNQFSAFRKILINNSQIQSLLYRSPFPNITTDTLIYIIKPKYYDKNNYIKVGDFNKKLYKIKQNFLLKIEDYQFLPLVPIVKKIYFSGKNCLKLINFAESNVGFIAKSKKITNVRINNEQNIIYKGRNIKRYNSDGGFYFHFTKNNLAGGTQNIQKLSINEKILLRKTGYPLIASYDDSGLFPEQSLYFIHSPKTNLNLKFILAIINSKIFQYLYWNWMITNKNSTPQLKKIHLDNYPIPNLDFSTPTDKKRHDQMTKYVDRMLELHKRIERVKTPYEKTNIQNQISATDKAIDKLVYELYELTEKEIKIVEGALT